VSASAADADALDAVASRLAAARRVTVLTGAGVSAASGVPTFRGAGGLWKQYRPEDLATPEAFERDPRLVWEWYDWRRSLIARCVPNRAHEVIASWSRHFPVFQLLTQNVDDLHDRAGTGHIVRLHGSIWMLRCWIGCGAPPWVDPTAPLPSLPPRCASCGGIARPGVVWFGEALAADDLQRADRACGCDVFLIAGTSAVVHPAAGLAGIAASRGAFVVEINPEETAASPLADVSVRGTAERVLDDLACRLSW
jgi:NAD-dependent deacetylase